MPTQEYEVPRSIPTDAPSIPSVDQLLDVDQLLARVEPAKVSIRACMHTWRKVRAHVCVYTCVCMPARVPKDSRSAWSRPYMYDVSIAVGACCDCCDSCRGRYDSLVSYLAQIILAIVVMMIWWSH